MADTKETNYDGQFFSDLEVGSLKSAKATVPIVLDLLPCNSVVDVGCGVGAWLSVFKSLGVPEVLGLDGDYVDRSRLYIAENEFLPVNLASPPSVGRRFDLAVSLEVAEHLPMSAADDFIRFLTTLSETVLFSAAIPGQGGTAHVNEQWPDFWAGLFAKHGFQPVDCIREKIWQNDNVEWWYAQNIFVFATKGVIAANPRLTEVAAGRPPLPPRVVHPGAFEARTKQRADLEQMVANLKKRLLPENMHFMETLSKLPTIFGGALKRRFRK